MSGVRVPPRPFFFGPVESDWCMYRCSLMETRTLSARSLTLRPYRFSPRSVVAMAAVAAIPLAGASAQRRAPDPVPRVMIATFQSADKDLGQKAAEELRNRVTRDADARKLVVIPKTDINKTLEASGYP